MTQWVRNAVMLIVTGTWAVAILVPLLMRHEQPEAFTWGIPAGVAAALYPGLRRREKPEPTSPPTEPEPR